MLFPMHSAGMKDTMKQDTDGHAVMKPSVVVSYDEVMRCVDRSDQLAMIDKFVRKFVKWCIDNFLVYS